MARNFDGTNDNLLSADNAIAGVNVDQKSYSWWQIRAGDPAAQQAIINLMIANGAGNGRAFVNNTVPLVAGFRPQYEQSWSGANALWNGEDVVSTDRHHIVITHDRSGAIPGNLPVIYVDNVSQTVIQVTIPTGTLDTGDDTLKCGENAGGSQDLAASIQHISIYAGLLFTAEQVNRALWWGRPMGGAVIYHPLITDKLADEGSAAETLTANGTTVVPLTTPVVRPSSSLMGMGIGW